MRMIITMASLLIVSILVFKGYSSSWVGKSEHGVVEKGIDPRDKAAGVNRLIQDAASNQRQELEKQIQQ